MKKIMVLIIVPVVILTSLYSCKQTVKQEANKTENSEMQKLVDEYAEVELSADLSYLSENQKLLIAKLIECSDIMDDLFWKDATGVSKEEFLSQIPDSLSRRFAEINYGAYDRLDNEKVFLSGFDSLKPKGANFYPKDITEEEFNALEDSNKNSDYTFIRRDKDGKLFVVWYHEEYAEQIEKAAKLLEEASELAEDEGFKTYLKLRATALRTDDYLESDLAWMDMKTNLIDFVVGPIETYEDGFRGIKASHNGQILLKDIEWTKKLEHFTALLPKLQESLPVDPEYKKEKPGLGDLNVYNVIYYAGDCNVAGKNIAINLPNDPRVHLAKGSRKLQLKNTMQAKFDKILVPIANLLIDESQTKHIKFEDAFFQNVMFHEVAHGLGIKNTIKDNKPVREVIGEYYSAVEEAKADLGGLYIVTKLAEMGELPGKDLMDNYVTFLAGIFRSIRFGASEAHGQSNLIQFYYFRDNGAFEFNAETGKYKVNFDKMKAAVESLEGTILKIQGDGDKAAAKAMLDKALSIDAQLQASLDKVANENIPRDIVFKQGKSVLGL